MSATNLKAAADLVRQYTAGSCRVGSLAGPACKARRRHIMSVLHGTGALTDKCGVNALRKALYDAAGITGTCAADADNKFAAWCARSPCA